MPDRSILYLFINSTIPDGVAGIKVSIVYRAIQDWGHQSEEWMKNANICDPTHPKHNEFLEEFYKVSGDTNVISNVFHLLDAEKANIRYNNLI